MKAYSLQKLAEAMGGTLVGGGGELVMAAGVSTDTRSIPNGALFVALKGENFDAHDFLEQAAAAGAGALVIEKCEGLPSGLPAVVVNDTLKALQDLAAWYRVELGLPVVAISGSNGKTSTKDLTFGVLSRRFRVNATKGNLNNHIGVPLTMLSTRENDEVVILEMGMNHAGELAPLCEIGKPDLSIITNVGTAHIEHLGSREAIAAEKGTLARALTEKGTLLIPSDCDFLEEICSSTRGRVIMVGEGVVRAEQIEAGESGSTFDLVIEGLGRTRVGLPVAGRHMIDNALLAAGAGMVLGLELDEIARGLEEAELTSGRLRQYQSGGVTVIDDTYNANPESVVAALQTLAGLPGSGRRIAVLGRMAELGNHAVEAYPRIGQLAGELNLMLVTAGEEAGAYGGVKHIDSHEEAADWLAGEAAPGDLVLFKGSRLAAMERIMNRAFPAETN